MSSVRNHTNMGHKWQNVLWTAGTHSPQHLKSKNGTQLANAVYRGNLLIFDGC